MNREIEKLILKKITDDNKIDEFSPDELITPEAKEYYKLLKKYRGNEVEIMWAVQWTPIEDYGIDIIWMLWTKTEYKYLLQDLREEKWKQEMIAIKQKASMESDMDKLKELLSNIPEYPTEVEDMSFDEVVEEVVMWILGEWKPIKKLSTWFIWLDNKLDWGFYPWTLNIIAWRPGTGKSTYALSIFNNQVLWQWYNWIYFSLEMWRKEVLQRIFSNQTGLDFSSIRSWKWVDSYDIINKCLEKIKESKIEIVDNLFKFENICSRIREKKKEWLDIAYIDYLWLMEIKADNKYQEISIMTRRLKELSRECEIPIILLSQLNRNNDQRWDKTPKLSDLRDSGSIEQDADSVLMLYRPDEESDEIDLRIRKNRNWPSDVCIEYKSEYQHMNLKEV